jgi:hypothetical protein
MAINADLNPLPVQAGIRACFPGKTTNAPNQAKIRIRLKDRQLPRPISQHMAIQTSKSARTYRQRHI